MKGRAVDDDKETSLNLPPWAMAMLAVTTICNLFSLALKLL